MKISKKNITIAFLVLLSTPIVILLVYPQIIGSWNSYFDTNNGRLKIEQASLGVVYRRNIEETHYSKLLKKFGFNEQPSQWRPANSQAFGLRLFFAAQHVHHDYAKTPSDVEKFCIWLELQNDLDSSREREHVIKFRDIVTQETPKHIHEYVKSLQK